MKISKILWPTDFSHACDKILPYVCDLAQDKGAEIEVLYVGQDLGAVAPWYGDASEEHIRDFNKWEREHSEKRLENVCQLDLGSCPAAKKKTVVGDPYQEIMNAIKQDKIDMVVMATWGRGAEKRGERGFGGVASKVAANSPVPVMLINPGDLSSPG